MRLEPLKHPKKINGNAKNVRKRIKGKIKEMPSFTSQHFCPNLVKNQVKPNQNRHI
jgi:hypothetical protein